MAGSVLFGREIAVAFLGIDKIFYSQGYAIPKSNGSRQDYENGYRITFTVSRSTEGTINRADIRIYGTTQETHKLISREGLGLSLSAGYRENEGAKQIFIGTVAHGVYGNEGGSWYTALECLDGLYEYRDTKINYNFPPGTYCADALQVLVNAFMIPTYALPKEIDRTIRFDRGYTANGYLRNHMDEVCRKCGCYWKINDGKLLVVMKGTPYRTLQRQAVLISPLSGLIDSPKTFHTTTTDKKLGRLGLGPGMNGIYKKAAQKGRNRNGYQIYGVRCRSLLQPLIQVGDYVCVNSKMNLKTGRDYSKPVSDYYEDVWYYVWKLRHSGDSHGTLTTDLDLITPQVKPRADKVTRGAGPQQSTSGQKSAQQAKRELLKATLAARGART